MVEGTDSARAWWTRSDRKKERSAKLDQAAQAVVHASGASRLFSRFSSVSREPCRSSRSGAPAATTTADRSESICFLGAGRAAYAHSACRAAVLRRLREWPI